MGEKFLEVKLPQDLIDIIPQERITGDILRGHGPRRGNLEALLKYWRPIMRLPGGFRRCIVILANHPELYPLQRICAWLHHETTGKWPNEGNHHGGGRAARLAGRVARRAIPGKRRRRRKKSADGGVEISAWRLYRRLSREVGGISTRLINGDLNTVEFKAARFKQGMRSVPVPGSFDWDEDYTEPVEEKVGLISSHGRLGRSLQSIASFFIPGDMGKFRSPLRSLLWGSLTPGGGGGGGRGGIGGGLPSIAGAALRCPSGYDNGGRFSDEKLSNCGGLVFDVPAKGPGAVTAAERSQLTRRFARGDDLPDVEREVVAKKPKGDPFAVVREAAMPGARTSSARRDSAVNAVVEFASKNRNTTRVVRRDGVIFEPRVSPDELVKMKDHDNMRDAVYVTSKIGRKSIAGEEIRLLTKGAKAIEYVFPEGSVRVERRGKIGPTLGARMRTRWAGISRDPDIAANPAKTIETFVQEFSENFSIKPKFKEIPKANERVVVYTSTGKKRVVPRWVFSLYLSERAPRRASSTKPFYLAPPTARYPKQKDEYWRPERGEYAALMMQHKALALRLDPLNGRKRNTSDIRISEVWGMNKDSLIDIKAARFSMSEDRFDIAVKVFGRRSIGGRSISRMARRMPKVVPYNPDARDGDNDGIVQEGTIWERPSGAVFRGLARGARALMGSVDLVDTDGNKIDYKPGDHDNSPLRRRRIAGRVAEGLEGVRAGQRGRIRERDRELGAEADMSEIDRRGELRRANRRRDRLQREIGRLQGRPERRDRRAEGQEERGQADVDRAEGLRVRREARNDFDVERRELEERQRREREELEDRDPRRQRRQERRGERRERAAGALDRVRDAANVRIRERDRDEGAEVDREELDRGGARRDRRAERRGQRRERMAARLDRLREGQEGRIDERDREEGAPVEREPLYRPVDRVVDRLRELFGVSTLKEQQDEDNERVAELTGKPVAEVVDGVADVLIPEVMAPESEARNLQDMIDAVIDADGGSLPDDRSRRNVRNRFPDRGLPERAFWLGEGFRADQREHHDRRFGRYYDDDGNLNDRGRLVNEQLRIEREAEAGAETPEHRRRAHELSRLLLGEMNRNALEEFGPADRDEPYGPVPDFTEGRSWGEEAPEWSTQQKRAWLHRDEAQNGLPEGVGEVPSQRRAVERALFDNLIDARGEEITFRFGDGVAGLLEWDEQDFAIALRRMVADRHDERPGGQSVVRQIQGEIARRHASQPALDNRHIDKVMADEYPNRPEDMRPTEIYNEMRAIDGKHPDILDRPFLPGRRFDELEAAFEALSPERQAMARGEAAPPDPAGVPDLLPAGRPARQRPLGREASMARDGVNQAMDGPNPDESRALMILLDASEGILDPVIDGVAGGDEDRIRQLAILLADAPEGSVVGQHPRLEAVYNALRNRLGRGSDAPARPADQRLERLGIPDPLTLPPDLPANLTGQQRRANRVWQAAERVLGAEAVDDIVRRWPEVFDAHARDGAGERLLDPIIEALLLERGGLLRGGFGDVDQKNSRREAIRELLLDTDVWGGEVPQAVKLAWISGRMDPDGVLRDADDEGISDLLRAIEANMGEVDRPDLLRERLQKVYDAYSEAISRLNVVDGGIPLAEHARDALNADPENPGLLRERVKSQLYRRAFNATKTKLNDERREVDAVLQRMSGGAQGVIPRPNPANEPNVPTGDQVFLQEVVDRALNLRLGVVSSMWADTIADGREGPKFGWEQFGIADPDAMWDNPNLSAPHQAAVLAMVQQAYRLGDERRFTSPDDPDVEFRVVTNAGEIPDARISKTGNEISYSFSARIEYRRRGEFPADPRHTPNPDGGWGEWVSSGSTGRSGTIRKDGTGHMSNNSMYVDDRPPSPEASVRGKRFATVYNYNAWMTLQATGGVKTVGTGPVRDGTVVWGLQGFHSVGAASNMVHILRGALTDFRANGPGGSFQHGVGARGSVRNPILTPEMADEVERLLRIADAGDRVTILMGHMILNPNRDHPWMREVNPDADRDEQGGMIRFMWGKWWDDHAPTGSGTVPLDGQFAEAFARVRRELIGPDGPDGPPPTPEITAVDPRLPELRAPGVGRRKAVFQNVDEGGRPRLHVGDGVVPGGENITTQDLANSYLTGGGDIRAIPPEFIVGALDAHPGVEHAAAVDAGQTRFERVNSAGVTHSVMYFALDDAGERTGHGYILKNADDTPGAQGNEIIGLQMAGLLGWAWGGHAKDGVNEVGQPYILMELAPNMAEVDHVLPYADVHFPARPELQTLDMVDQRIDSVLFSYMLGNSDSHTGNNLVMIDENGVAVGVMPIDFGRIGPDWRNFQGQPDFRSWYRDDNPFGGEGPRGEGSSGANLPQHISRLITDGELTEEHMTERVTAMVDRMEEIERDHLENIIGDITVLTTGHGRADEWGADQQAPSGINDMAGARVAMAAKDALEIKTHISGRIAWMRNNIDAIVSALVGR